jgi:hypothetical protein
MDPHFQRIIQYIIQPEILQKLNSNINIVDELNLIDSSVSDIVRKINVAFLIFLAGMKGEVYKKAKEIFISYKNQSEWRPVIQFYEVSLNRIKEEIACDKEGYSKLHELTKEINTINIQDNNDDILKRVNNLFFPEGAGLDRTDLRTLAVDELRKKRSIKVTELNTKLISEPAKQILFTSNILATMPLEDWDIDKLDLSLNIRHSLKSVQNEKQKYWYDHPIPLGIAPEKNEAIYGLRGLDEMIEFEKSTDRIPSESKLTCLLSASTTHDGLHAIVKEYFEYEFKKNGQFKNLDVFIFTETDTNTITEQILIPLIDRFLSFTNKAIIYRIFGVDGEYGRHYSFLKAVAAFWQVFIDPDVKATFKIDLDQVFPQEILLQETGNTALDHFRTPLWGAKGIDSSGNEVDLSLIAGALVNQNDIEKSLYTPDVIFPEKIINTPDSLIFNSKIPQALSTEAEMMSRYNNDDTDEVIQRIHVTGGTNGILIDALRKFRPFTPSIIGRAEDQAYLLSVLFKHEPALRYLHKPGLIMRHDKHAFAGDAIAAAAAGKLIGDYIRILIFSAYARALPWDFKKIKSEIDPFTGSFVSNIPITIVMLRFAFKLLELSEKGEEEFLFKFQKLGSERLIEWFNRLSHNTNYVREIYEEESSAWNIYYDLLDITEDKLRQDDPFVAKIKNDAKRIIENCQIKFK